MPELVADVSAATDIGRRARQEDALITDFSQGSALGLAVLSDGMGGHDDGDLASRIIVSEMFGELYFSGARVHALVKNVPHVFRTALNVANKRLERHTKAGSLSEDTGGTLVSLALVGERLNWISVGDSPLYLYRAKGLRRLNENHSMAPQIDLMVRQGIMDADTGRDHPQRNCLTSAITGREVNKIDCPEHALTLQDRDIVILASDGLNVLSDPEIQRLLRRTRRKPSQTIADALMRAVKRANDPDQDNISLVVIKMTPGAQTAPFRLGSSLQTVAEAAANRIRALPFLKPVMRKVGL